MVGNTMSLVKRSTSLRPYLSMTQEGMADRARGEARSPRRGGCTPARAAPRSVLPPTAPRDSMAGGAGPHRIGLGRSAVPWPRHSAPELRPALFPRPGGTRGQWETAFLAALPMVPLGVAARWRRPGAAAGVGCRRAGGRESAAGSGAGRHAACLPPPGEWRPPALRAAAAAGWRANGRAGGGAGSPR